MDPSLIDHFESGAEKLSLAIRGLSRDDLLTKPSADAPKQVGKWSIQQVVLHLMDSDLVMSDRMKRVIAEDNPQLLAYDENKWTSALHYDDQSVELATQLVELNRKQMAAVLRKLPATAFSRFGTHSESGKKTLLDLVQMEVNHLEHHLKFIHAKRAAMGKEMW
jgi:hypothetical protein